jgi:hypothetical protein
MAYSRTAIQQVCFWYTDGYHQQSTLSRHSVILTMFGNGWKKARSWSVG